MKWTKNCVISEIYKTPDVPPNPNPNVNPPNTLTQATVTTGAIFQKNNVPVITLSTNDNIKFLENIKQRFKRKISRNKCRSEIKTQQKNNKLDYLIDPTFRNINRLFVLSFKNGDNDHTRYSFD